MTELEKVQRAKMYLDKLANGVDPVSGTEVPEDNVLNNVRLSRCFFYVSDILRQVLENGGEVGAVKSPKAPKKVPFYLSEEKRKSFAFSREPLRVTEIALRLNALIDAEKMRRISPVMISNWLLRKGFLARAAAPDGKNVRIPTKQGEYIGLSSLLRQSMEGEYYAVMYSEAAQHFVLDNLDDILRKPEA